MVSFRTKLLVSLNTRISCRSLLSPQFFQMEFVKLLFWQEKSKKLGPKITRRNFSLIVKLLCIICTLAIIHNFLNYFSLQFCREVFYLPQTWKQHKIEKATPHDMASQLSICKGWLLIYTNWSIWRLSSHYLRAPR